MKCVRLSLWKGAWLLWLEYASIVYPATSKKAVAHHGLTKHVDARYEDGQQKEFNYP
jgi:hypothetical protein